MTSRAHWLLIDSNVLLYAMCDFFVEHQQALNALRLAEASGYQLCFSTQIVRECLAVATGPLQSKLPVSVADSVQRIAELSESFAVLLETSASLERLRELVSKHDIRGRRIHDANIVAAMLTHRVPALLTNNPLDFQLFFTVIRVIPLASAAEVLA